METNKHKKLQKSRSSQACIREGYRFYMSHFRRIFRVTWLIAIVFAVITAATSAMPVIISPDLLIPAIAIETVAVVLDRKSTRLNSSHIQKSRMPSSA